MSRDPKYTPPEFEDISLTPELAARLEVLAVEREAKHAAGMEQVLADAEAHARREAARAGLSTDPDIYGAHCINCQERWCLPADEASCAHTSICEDCWPNGCPQCEAEVEATLRRREESANRILSAALEIRTSVDDLSETDLKSLGWVARKDILRHVDLTFEALRRVRDVLKAQEEKR